MNEERLWVLAVYFGAVLLLAGAMLLLSYVLGERHRGYGVDVPFESGVLPTGSARIGISAKFYLVAMLFVIFDVETIFLVTWALAIPALGWLAYAIVSVFVVILLVALAYLLRSGVLDWNPPLISPR